MIHYEKKIDCPSKLSPHQSKFVFVPQKRITVFRYSSISRGFLGFKKKSKEVGELDLLRIIF